MWKGIRVPHIDPLKEVNAVREMLGENGKSIPLITVEQACDMLNTGDSDENIKQFSEELHDVKELDIYIQPNQGGTNTPQNQKVPVD
jgi:capsid protein